MIVKRKSIITGIERERDMPLVTEEKLKEWRPGAGQPAKRIQDVFPELSDDDREFLLTGVTRDEIAEHLIKDKKSR